MPTTDISSAERSDLKSQFTSGTENYYDVSPETTDGAEGTQETTWVNTKWSDYLGYYKKIPELRSVIDAVATWTIGKGFEANSRTTAILDYVTGWGADTFNTIIENAIRTCYIGGDFFAEIIRDEEGDIANLKPLDPSSIQVVVNKQGIIKRYEQLTKTKEPNKKYDPIKIFHLSRNRVADEIHGISLIEALEDIILMRNEAMSDWKRVLHRNVDPLMIFHLDTDDTAKISAFKAKMDAAKGKGENMYIPQGAVVPEQLTMAPNASLNPLPWIEALNNYFFQAAGVPQIIVGGSNEYSEATAKIAYLAFQQRIEEEQLFIEEQIWEQLGYEVSLEFPASLENELLSDKSKDGAVNMQQNETTAGAGQ